MMGLRLCKMATAPLNHSIAFKAKDVSVLNQKDVDPLEQSNSHKNI